MKKVLIQFAHPARSRSKMNNALRSAVEGLENVTFNDLYANYPDFLIDVKREQELCEEHDVILFQHPFYWYSTPSIIKEWLDLVLEHGWAYGSKGTSLNGKIFMQAITGGGDDSTYQKDGLNKFTITELTTPMQATANLCGMIWLPPFTVLGVHRGLDNAQTQSHADSYKACIESLVKGELNIEKIRQKRYFNS